MFFIKSKYEKELDYLIAGIVMNMSNNYKDAAQKGFVELEELFNSFVEEGKLKPTQVSSYEIQLKEFREKLKGYTHKDQPTGW